MLRAEHQSAWMSKITNDNLNRFGTGCFIAVPIWHQWASKGEWAEPYHSAAVTKWMWMSFNKKVASSLVSSKVSWYKLHRGATSTDYYNIMSTLPHCRRCLNLHWHFHCEANKQNLKRFSRLNNHSTDNISTMSFIVSAQRTAAKNRV